MKNIPKGRKRAGWEKEFLKTLQKAANDLGNVTEKEILSTVREYRLKLDAAARAKNPNSK